MKKIRLTSKVSSRDLNRCLILKVQETFGEKWGCSSAGRAPALQAGGHRFDPVHLHHFREEEGQVGETHRR